MTTQLVAYLAFKDNCREAMNFYKEAIGGELELMSFGDSPMGEHTPPEQKKLILHSSLTKGSITLFASDMMGMGGVQQGNTVSLCLVCSTEAELNEYFEKLSVGGKVNHPPKLEFWGDIYSDFVDKYGMNWMLNCRVNQPANS